MSNDPGHFFQTEYTNHPHKFWNSTNYPLRTTLANAKRRAAKSSNKNGSPITLTSKLLSIIPDLTSPMRVYIAESGGIARRIDLEVCKNHKSIQISTESS